jgi:uncharacterized protein
MTAQGAPPAFHLLAKPTGAQCNLDCDYCFFLSKEMLYPDSRFRMSEAPPRSPADTHPRTLRAGGTTPAPAAAGASGRNATEPGLLRPPPGFEIASSHCAGAFPRP